MHGRAVQNVRALLFIPASLDPDLQPRDAPAQTAGGPVWPVQLCGQQGCEMPQGRGAHPLTSLGSPSDGESHCPT